MEREFELLKIGRQKLLTLLNNYGTEELVKTPKGFSNNILWNAGHIVTSQQRLCYGLAGLPLNTPNEYIKLFAKDSSPKDWTITPDVAALKEIIIQTTEGIERDYKKGIFAAFKTYPTSYGYTLKSIEDAIGFNNIHEAIHLSTARCIGKLVK